MNYKSIDMATFPRRKHFEFFNTMQSPHVGMTCNVDVTDLVQFCKRNDYSFYLVFIHLVALAADSVNEFRQRIHGYGIREYDECLTSHTELLDNGTYCYCSLKHHMPFDEYILYAEQTRLECRQQASIKEADDVDCYYFISTFPWKQYTDLIQPVRGPQDSNPRFTWGKFELDHNGRAQMPVSVLGHHGLIDGLHIARFYQSLEEQILELTR